VEALQQSIRVYRAGDDSEPFTRWFGSLRDSDAVARIARCIDRLESGNFGDCKPVGKGVQELRIDYGPGYRVYLGRDGDTTVILLAGGNKKTQNRDIETAKLYWRDYKERKQ
jgi:putative addiction module killer protein